MGSSFSPWYMTFAFPAPLMSPHSKKSLTSGCYLTSKSGSLRLTRIWAPKDQVQLKKGALRQDLSKSWATKSPSTYPTKKEILKTPLSERQFSARFSACRQTLELWKSDELVTHFFNHNKLLFMKSARSLKCQELI